MALDGYGIVKIVIVERNSRHVLGGWWWCVCVGWGGRRRYHSVWV